MKNKLPFIFVLIFEIALFFVYDLPAICFFIFIITCIEVLLIFKKNSCLQISGWWLFIYIFCSFLFIPLFKFTPTSFSLSVSNINEQGYHALAEMSIYIFCVYFLSIIIFVRNGGKKYPTLISNYSPFIHPYVILGIGFVLSVISLILGIGRMGEENHTLPFHLTGVVEFLRTDFVPAMALCTYANLKSKKKSPKGLLLMFFLWTLLETYVRFSKSAMLYSFLPIIIYEMLTNRSKFNLKKVMPIIIAISLIYPVVEILRNDSSDSDIDVRKTFVGTYSTPNVPNPFVKPFNRVFLSGYLFLTDIQYVSDDWFNFNHVPLILAYGGIGRFQTIYIDGYSETAHHSSGSSPFIDGLLVGGRGMLIISVFIMTLMAELIDRRSKSGYNYVIVALLTTLYIHIFEQGLFTFFLNDMEVKFVIVYFIICMYILFSMKKHKKLNNVISHTHKI